jgi:hypothetical protein
VVNECHGDGQPYLNHGHGSTKVMVNQIHPFSTLVNHAHVKPWSYSTMVNQGHYQLSIWSTMVIFMIEQFPTPQCEEHSSSLTLSQSLIDIAMC